jgi:hypothetical protein
MNFHIPETQSQVLAGKVGLVTGIASDESIRHRLRPGLARCRSSSVYWLKILAIAIALSSAATEFGGPLGGQGVH